MTIPEINPLKVSDQAFKQLSDAISVYCGLELKNKKLLVEGRLGKLVLASGLKDMDLYIKTLLESGNKQQWQEVVDHLLTNYTFFMRENQHFEYYKEIVLAQIHLQETKDLRVWCAACSTGEEAYTLSILHHEYKRQTGASWNTQLLATDLSEKVLEIAKKGVFTEEAVKHLPEAWQRLYFKKTLNSIYEVQEALRQDIIFRKFNLMTRPFPFKNKFHVIFCRNVMIYFNGATKEALIKALEEGTEEGGYLFVGGSEMIETQGTSYRYQCPGVYRKMN